ncbi:MAG: hypothetical protein Q7T33_09075, partial [Dehalococcoidia bacterium]|nr:hypothetical protein [Dehalococcoidia bacterium]
PDTVERTVHLVGWTVLTVACSWLFSEFLPSSTHGSHIVPAVMCPLVSSAGVWWGGLGLYRWFRDR